MILYKTKYLTLMAAKREDKPDWVYVRRDNAKNVVVILPVFKKSNGEYVMFLITKRPPLIEEKISEFSIELPAGLVGDENENETLMEAAKKELLEETGYRADLFEICAKKVSTSGGLTSEVSTILKAFIASDNVCQTPVNDGGVIVDRVLIKKENIKAFLNKKEKEGYSLSAQTLAALYYL